MPDVLIFADSIRSAEMRHEVPLAVPDPFLYVERDGRRLAVASSMEVARIAGLDGMDARPVEDYDYDELIRRGVPYDERMGEIAVRAVRELGLTQAVVPATFPIAVADLLRAEGVEITADGALFRNRRLVKNDAELEGIRRAQRAAEAGMHAAAAMLRGATAGDGGGLVLDGEPLTCERIKVAIATAFLENGASAEDMIVAHGAQAARGHDMGSGQVAAGEPVVIDIWPRDNTTGCYADMTRTFVVGEAPEELVAQHRATLESLRRSLAAIRAGADGGEVFRVACEVFHEAGYPTQLSKAEGEILQDGFFHGLGHGVGLEVHEGPYMGRTRDVLAAGNVVTVEPGCYRQGFGGCRLEDLVLVTADGIENLTDFPYDLTP